MVLVGVCSALTIVPTLPELASTAKESSYEQIYSTFNSCYAVGNIVGPIAGGALVHYLGFSTALLVVGATIVGYVFLSTLLSPKVKNDEGSEKESLPFLTTNKTY
jgi:predicted MFS family arabinose efflux permease